MAAHEEMAADNARSAVIRAVHHLHGSGRWPTVDEIAAHLETSNSAVTTALRELKRRRIFRDRTREKRRVWMPWGEA